MDNIIEILIYLFIIFSIFSPLFKKKGPKAPEPPQTRSERTEPPPFSTETIDKEQTEYDILKEIESLFKTDTSVQPEIKEKQTAIEQKEERKQTPIERVSAKSREPKIVRPRKSEGDFSEHRYTDWNKKIQVDDAVARKAAQFAEMMKKKKKDAEYLKANDLRTKMKNPETLRDYIIFSEILGKPKALRR